MSISRVTLWMAVLAACSTGVQAEQVLRDPMHHHADRRLVLPINLAFGLTARAADDEPATFLAQALAAAPPREGAWAGTSLPSGRWSAAHAADLAVGQAETNALIEALSALGPLGVSVADYLALTLPGLDNPSSTSKRPPPVEGAKPRSAPVAAPATPLAPRISVIAAPAPAAGPAALRSLSPALTEALTRYLLAAAALAILAGTGLRWLVSARRNGSPSLARL